MKRLNSSKLFHYTSNKYTNYKIDMLNKHNNNYSLSRNIFSFNKNRKKFSINDDIKDQLFSSYNGNNNLRKNFSKKNMIRYTHSGIFSPLTHKKKYRTKKELMIFTDDILNMLKEKNKISGEDILNENNYLKKDNNEGNLVRLKSDSLISFNNNISKSSKSINKNKNNQKLFLTSTILTNSSKENIKKPKNKIKKNYSTNALFKKSKPIEEILIKKEREFESNYKTPKSLLSEFNKYFKNSLLDTKKIQEKNKFNFKYIKSDLEQKTLSIKIKQKINLSKLKEYSKRLKYFLESDISSKKIQRDINSFRYKKYVSFKHLEILKKIKKSLLDDNDINLLGCVNLRDFYKNKKNDPFNLANFYKNNQDLNKKINY